MLLPITAVLALTLAGVVLWRQVRQRRRQRAMGEVLDAADALERRLRQARERTGVVAGAGDDPARGALQEILRQRLWLQQHGHAAPLAAIEDVRDAMREAERRMRGELDATPAR